MWEQITGGELSRRGHHHLLIFHRGTERVEGITTAASLLLTAAIGATVGLGQWFLPVSLTAVVLIVLCLLAGPI